MKRLSLKIHGQVQGVFFRTTVQKKAHALGLAGWVKNMPDGTVELIAEGEENNLKKMLEFCEKGTEYARVSRVDKSLVDIEKVNFEGFEIEY